MTTITTHLARGHRLGLGFRHRQLFAEPEAQSSGQVYEAVRLRIDVFICATHACGIVNN
jgi:hypothetical protein